MFLVASENIDTEISLRGFNRFSHSSRSSCEKKKKSNLCLCCIKHRDVKTTWTVEYNSTDP